MPYAGASAGCPFGRRNSGQGAGGMQAPPQAPRLGGGKAGLRDAAFRGGENERPAAGHVGQAWAQQCPQGAPPGLSLPRQPLREVTNSARLPAPGSGLPPKGTVILPEKPRAQEPAAAPADAEACLEYLGETAELLFRRERDFLPNPMYLEMQPELSAEMRAVLVDWIVDVALEFKLTQDTLFLTVNLVDRYLSRKAVARTDLQLVGVAALLAAAKFEELSPPTLEKMVYITDRGYSRREIINMECRLLVAVGFEVLVPTAWSFLQRLRQGGRLPEPQLRLAACLLELALHDLRALRHQPSRLAAAAALLASECDAGIASWSAGTAAVARYSQAALEPAAQELRALLQAAARRELQAVPRKYAAVLERATRPPAARSGTL